MNKTILIGKNSLIADAFVDNSIKKISHKEILKINFKKYHTLILCSFPPKYYLKMENNFFFEKKIFSKFRDKKIFYISTSKVYDFKLNCSEKAKPCPKSIYANNKLKIEKLIKKYTKKYIIFRLSNIFAVNKCSKNTFFYILNKNWLQRKIIFDQPLSTKKDFISISALKVIFRNLNIFNEGQIYNIGCGKAISLKNLLIILFGKSYIKYIFLKKSYKNVSQSLDINKLLNILKTRRKFLYFRVLKDLKKININL